MIFPILLSLLFYCVSATPISATHNSQKIIGGFDAYPGQFPYQALIRHSNQFNILCGGSIISNQWILTSARCTKMNLNKIRIVVGSIYLNSGGTTHTVLISLAHPDFVDDSSQNDIGLMRVNGQISYNEFVQAIPLSTDSISVGLPLTVAGWGVTNISVEAFPNTLQFVTLKSMSLNECTKLFINVSIPLPLTDMQMCTHINNRQGLCFYDSGSPVVYNRQQHAVVSMPVGCYYGCPDVHTRILPFRSWIKDITNV